MLLQGGDAMSISEQSDYPLDHVHRWRDWCAMVGISTTTGWRVVKAGKGPIITKLSPKLIGVRHRHSLAWLAARERQDSAA
jgi:predicted DNA-binding transcriptional regulator AlpA